VRCLLGSDAWVFLIYSNFFYFFPLRERGKKKKRRKDTTDGSARPAVWLTTEWMPGQDVCLSDNFGSGYC